MSWVTTFLKLAEERVQRPLLEVEQALNNARRRLAGSQLKVAETAEKGRTAPEVALSALGETGSMVGDVLNLPLEVTGVNEAIGKAAEAAMSTDLGQAAMQKVQQVQQQYPRASENVGNLFGAMNIIPGLQAPRVVGQAANKLLRNVDTMVEGGPLKALEAPLQKLNIPAEGMFNFYGPLPVLSFAGEAAQAVPSTIREIFSPTARANERVKGISQRRVEEITAPESTKGELDVGSAYAGENMYRQAGRNVDETMIANLPMTAKNTRIITPDWDEKTLSAEIFEPLDAVPLQVQERALNHVRVVHKADNGNTSIVVREPQTQGFTKEGKGLSSRGSPAIRTLTASTVEKYAKALGKTTDTLDAADIEDIVKASFIVNNKKTVRKLKRQFPELVDKKGALKQQEVIIRYLKGNLRKKEGKKPFAGQEKILNFVGDSSKDVKVNTSDDGNFIYFSQGYHSEMKDLGGVNQFLAVDVKNKDIYTLISDRHDMFGFDPIGGSGLVTMGTMEKVSLGGKFDPEAHATKKAERQERVAKREQEAIAKTEELTGIKKKKDETADQYSKRVLRDTEFTPEAKDYLESLYRGSWAITAATETDDK